MTTPAPLSRMPIVLIGLCLACILPEIVLQGADWGLWGSTRLRSFVYQNGAFWNGLLHGWTPNYSQQPYLMFLTYAFLHAGFVHLAVNMITLVSVGHPEIQRIGQCRFALLYIVSAIGGALGFALLGTTVQPMVGASGALFGLLGAWIVWDVSDTLALRPGWVTLAYAILWPLLVLTILNLLMFWGSDGNLAWETHLGGFLAGAGIAHFLTRKRSDHPT